MQEAKTGGKQVACRPGELTEDGIRHLFDWHWPKDEILLQIIKISEDYAQNQICQISDGFFFVSCRLVGEARTKVIKGEVQVFDVIKLTKDNIMLLGMEGDPFLEVHNLLALNIRLFRTIGEPVSFAASQSSVLAGTTQQLSKGGSRCIADGQRIENTLDIGDLVDNYPHVPAKWILRARVARKPEKIFPQKPFMVIKLIDHKGHTIEGVLFGQAALEAHRKLVCNKEYLLSNGQIKTKKNKSDELQIKFTEQSRIIPIQEYKTPPPPQSDGPTSQLAVACDPPSSTRLTAATGRVISIKRTNRGRVLHVSPKSCELIEIVLWEEFQDEIKEGVTYSFQNLRPKNFNSNLSLHSVRHQTVITKAAQQIQNAMSSRSKSDVRYRQLRDAAKLVTVSEVLEMDIDAKEYVDVAGFLVLGTSFIDLKNFFKTECPKCPNVQDFNSEPVECAKCQWKNPTIRWNVRCSLMDQRETIKCVINEELSEKLMGVRAVQGFVLICKDKQKFRKMVQNFSYTEGVFKVKVNPFRDTVYYNILDIYKNDSLVVLKKCYKDLKLLMREYVRGEQAA